MRELGHLEVHVEERLHENAYVLYAAAHRNGYREIMLPVRFTLQREAEDAVSAVTEPAMVLPKNFGVTLMGALWRAGVRPRGHVDDHGPQVEALRLHLRDMRQLIGNQQAQLKAKDKIIEGLHRLLADSLGHNDV